MIHGGAIGRLMVALEGTTADVDLLIRRWEQGQNTERRPRQGGFYGKDCHQVMHGEHCRGKLDKVVIAMTSGFIMSERSMLTRDVQAFNIKMHCHPRKADQEQQYHP